MSTAANECMQRLSEFHQLSLTMNDLQRIILGQTTFTDLLKSGEIKAEGKQAELARFFSFFDAPASEPPALTAR